MVSGAAPIYRYVHTDIMTSNSEYAPRDFLYIILKKAFLSFTHVALLVYKITIKQRRKH